MGYLTPRSSNEVVLNNFSEMREKAGNASKKEQRFCD